MLNIIREFCLGFWDGVQTVFGWIFDTVLSLFTGMFLEVIKITLEFVLTFINALDLTELVVLQNVQSWTGIPDATIYILNYINITTCITALLGALFLRFILNIIPASITRI